ncbi:MAG: phosphoserine phosphatase SerB [Deltaproteobacteria bacterium RBG_16_71_12]|nr:MAG: phosphoserine phosphatase SerB [Deltaproteobacteria bacterium RBG_16_71_12]
MTGAAPPPTRRVLVTVAGPDAPGITASLAGIVARGGAVLLDIEQVVVQGQLLLVLLVGVSDQPGSGSPVIKDLLFAAKELGLELDFQVLGDKPTTDAGEARHSYALTVIGDVVDAAAVHGITSCLAEHGANIDAIKRLSDDTLSSLEIVVSLPRDEAHALRLRRDLLEIAVERAVDVALQRENLARRAKRLVVMDMDSTLIRIEVIDELARAHGVYDQVAAITKETMRGNLPYEESLRRRVALLAGLPFQTVVKVAADPPVTEGAPELLRVLRGLGLKTAVISGGFSVAADALRARLGIDYAYANQLEVKEGVLTGNVVDPIVGPQRKADLLDAIAQREGIALEQTIAVGDGANDLLMLERAGLGIAFHAKPKLRAAADTSLTRGGLDRILFLLGLRARDVREFLGG